MRVTFEINFNVATMVMTGRGGRDWGWQYTVKSSTLKRLESFRIEKSLFITSAPVNIHNTPYIRFSHNTYTSKKTNNVLWSPKE